MSAAQHRADPAAVRLLLLDEARDCDGVARAALVVPPSPSRYDKRPVTLIFRSLSAALTMKRRLEEVADARPA